ncbi:TPA: hypothetical protein ACOEN9_004297, partial [Stenotrophomonas maltophilia]
MSERIQVFLQRRLRRCLRQASEATATATATASATATATATATAVGRRWIVSKWLGRGGQAGRAVN